MHTHTQLKQQGYVFAKLCFQVQLYQDAIRYVLQSAGRLTGYGSPACIASVPDSTSSLSRSYLDEYLLVRDKDVRYVKPLQL